MRLTLRGKTVGVFVMAASLAGVVIATAPAHAGERDGCSKVDYKTVQRGMTVRKVHNIINEPAIYIDRVRRDVYVTYGDKDRADRRYLPECTIVYDLYTRRVVFKDSWYR